jgi:acyl-coenzyme A synthetase/AMP-(fatty) acid ligase
MSFGTLEQLSNQIAHALQEKLSLFPGDAVAICMPMTPESIAIYLGIVKSGCVVVSIADSFSAREIALRCSLANAKAIFTQDVIYRSAKFLPLYDRVLQADSILREQTSDEKETKSEETNGGDAHYSPMRVVVLPGMLVRSGNVYFLLEYI